MEPGGRKQSAWLMVKTAGLLPDPGQLDDWKSGMNDKEWRFNNGITRRTLCQLRVNSFSGSEYAGGALLFL